MAKNDLRATLQRNAVRYEERLKPEQQKLLAKERTGKISPDEQEELRDIIVARAANAELIGD